MPGASEGCAETDSQVHSGVWKELTDLWPTFTLPQLVENEDMIGTLIESNERIIAALEMYDTVSFTIKNCQVRRLTLHMTAF